ncbi:ImmA/IrrE family metallo-endopeptidase [Mucilaginibacter pedocola]|uniref:IrrE N-terminal-like domain-containing protein n=1 Tax=Mucilaginibacter pedocola TaxID=1792845 RepID=A0A1S9PA07_9SPHI|nr:ImmA/IrrE family metallo-endopeptidase [Mucilaginibacter pedocola]OOQ57418.1 hypothetical protein BC343_15075 [Mucilaginibacter pedocola]
MIVPHSNPASAARALHEYLGWTNPKDFTVDEIASSLGILVKDAPIEGSDGRILIKGKTAIITINSAITRYERRNFILTHEIGHFLLHKNISALFSDTELTLSEWYKKGIHEQEANTFASEFLMPEELFKAKVVRQKLSTNLIHDVAGYFGTSLLATFIRYVTLGEYPAMVIFMKDATVCWKLYSKDFPFTYLPKESKVPAWTVAGDYFYKGQLEAQPEKVSAIEWFPEDYQIKYKSDSKLWEQCYQVGRNCLVSCLWTN